MRFRDAPASPRRFDRRGRFLSGSERGVVLPDPFDPIAYINTPRWQTSRLGLDRIADLAVLVRLFFLGDGLDSTLADFSQGRIRTGMLAFVQQP